MSTTKHKLFGAVWCGNCTTAKKMLDAAGIEYDYINIDEDHESAVEHNIRSLPTMITTDGQRVIGSQKIKEIIQGAQQ